MEILVAVQPQINVVGQLDHFGNLCSRQRWKWHVPKRKWRHLKVGHLPLFRLETLVRNHVQTANSKSRTSGVTEFIKSIFLLNSNYILVLYYPNNN